MNQEVKAPSRLQLIYQEARREGSWFPDIILVILVYLVLVGLKLLWVGGADGPILFHDEFYYKTASESLFLGHGYTVSGSPFWLYPPLYPLVLAPSFLFGAFSYLWMLRINVLVSSTLVFPVWLIARRFLPRREALFCVLLAAVIPFHVVSSRMIMSENLFLPLFALAVYAVLLDTSEPSPFQCVATGVVWGLAYLTRHIFLATLPVFALAWWLQPWIIKQVKWSALFSRRRLLSAVMVLGGFLVVYAPWVLYSLSNNVGVLSAMGTGVMSGTHVGDYSWSGSLWEFFVIWIVLFSSYAVLMSGPYLQFFILFPLGALKRVERRDWFFAMLLFGLVGILVLISAYYSGGAWGVKWADSRTDGRYLMYPLPLMPVFAFLVLNRLQGAPIRNQRWALWVSAAMAAILVCVAYLVLIARVVWPLRPWFADITWVSMDVLAFNPPTLAPWGVSLLALFAILVLLETSAATLFYRYAPILVMLGVLTLYLTGLFYISNRFSLEQPVAIHGRVVAQLLQKVYGPVRSDKPVQILLDANTHVDKQYMRFSLAFYDIATDRFEVTDSVSAKSALPTSEPGLFITASQFPGYLVGYRVDNIPFYVYSVPIASDGVPAK